MSDPTPPRAMRTLVESDEFVRRHIGPSPQDLATMLRVVGAESVEGLLDETMPATIRSDTPLALPVSVRRGGVGSDTGEPPAVDRMSPAVIDT